MLTTVDTAPTIVLNAGKPLSERVRTLCAFFTRNMTKAVKTACGTLSIVLQQRCVPNWVSLDFGVLALVSSAKFAGITFSQFLLSSVSRFVDMLPIFCCPVTKLLSFLLLKVGVIFQPLVAGTSTRNVGVTMTLVIPAFRFFTRHAEYSTT